MILAEQVSLETPKPDRPYKNPTDHVNQVFEQKFQMN